MKPLQGELMSPPPMFKPPVPNRFTAGLERRLGNFEVLRGLLDLGGGDAQVGVVGHRLSDQGVELGILKGGKPVVRDGAGGGGPLSKRWSEPSWPACRTAPGSRRAWAEPSWHNWKRRARNRQQKMRRSLAERSPWSASVLPGQGRSVPDTGFIALWDWSPFMSITLFSLLNAV